MTQRKQSDWTEDDLVGGHPVLDFLNTTGGRSKRRDGERLTEFASFLAWCAAVGLLSETETAELRDRAHRDPPAAEDTLGEVRAFREALHACLMAEQAGSQWPDDAWVQVMAWLRDRLAAAQFEKIDGAYKWGVPVVQAGLRLPLDRLVLAAEALLRSGDLVRMRNCERCSWLFIDRGRGRPRRWCSMAACGSRAKSARYYRRKRAQETA
jgi:predicted RNA-binding Zn ribbon-like protein